MLWTNLLLGLLVLTAACFYWVFRRQRRTLRATQKRLDDVKTEESRVFEFLHGLGSAFSDTVRPTDLHRMIVEGAARILDAHGGALYLVDRNGAMLIPTFISKGCPPLVTVPAHILQQAAANSVALDSYLRLHPISLTNGAKNGSDSILSDVWQDKTAIFLPSGGVGPAPDGPARHGAAHGIRHDRPAALRGGQPRRARAGQRADEQRVHRDGFRGVQGHQRAVGLRALQRHRLLRGQREEDARPRPGNRPRHPAHPPAEHVAGGGGLRDQRDQHPGAAGQRGLFRLHQGGRGAFRDRHRRRVGQGRPGEPHHGDVPQRAALARPRPIPARWKCCAWSTGSFSRT